MIRYGLLALLALLWACQPASAQDWRTVATCGTLTFPTRLPGAVPYITADQTGVLCTSSGGGGGGNVTITSPVGAGTAAAAVRTTTASDDPLLAAVQAAIPDCGAVPCTNRIGVVGLNTWGGTALGTPTNFGTTPGAVVAAGVNASHFLGTVAASAGSGNVGTGTQRVVLATDQAALTNSLPVINGANAYKTVAAGVTAQSLGATGATGDYLSHCVVTPGTTSPGVVTILDNATAIVSFAGGASSVSNLVPFPVPIGALSVSGAWKITTGANVTVVCVGKFT